MSKKEEFLLPFHSKIFIFQQLFLWLQKVVLDLIYWIYKNILISLFPLHFFDPRSLYTQNEQKWLKMAFLVHLIVHHIKKFLLKLIQPWLVGRFEGVTTGYQPA